MTMGSMCKENSSFAQQARRSRARKVLAMLALSVSCIIFHLRVDSSSIVATSKIRMRGALEQNLLPASSPFCGNDGPFYGIVVDAASSGSRIRVFSWQSHNSPLVEVLPDPENAPSYETTPGVGFYAPEGKGAGESLSVLIDAAMRLIPKEKWAETQFYLQATAGLRLLEPSEASAVLRNISTYVADKKNCPFEVKAVEIISGRQEGFFAFRSINNGIKEDNDLSQWRGLLDLGGASTQVTFRPETDVQNQKFTFDVNHVKYSVYATSYLPFGLNVALIRYKEMIAKDTPAGGRIASPCHNPNYQETYLTRDGRAVEIYGEIDNGGECVSKSKELLYLRDSCAHEGCPTVGAQMGELRGDFYALSAFFYVAFDLGLVGWSDSIVMKPSQLSNAGIDYCKKDLPHKYDDVQKNACFQSIYAAAILDMYGFEDYNDGTITFTRMVDGHNGDWTMGSLLSAREDAVCEPKSPALIMRDH